MFPDISYALETPAVRTGSKIRVLLLSIWYPLSMSRYFERAMRRNPLIDLKTTGPYTGSFIPWMGGMTLPEKYAKPPDIPLPFPPNVGRVNYEFVKAQLGNWTPDIVVTVDAGINWTHKPQDGYVVTVGTDPHVLDYSHQRNISDKFFNMQLCYSEPKDIYLAYAFDPFVHYPELHSDGGATGILELEKQQDTDAILIGMPYEQRVRWIDSLRKHGVSCIFENAPVFDEYRELANRAHIGLNWSSMNDLNARAFEHPAFGLCPVNNRVPDLHLFFKEDVEYLGFSNLNEAVEKVLWAKNNPEKAQEISANAYKAVQPHTYDKRVENILRECGF